MKWRWLAVVSLSFMLSACAETFNNCPMSPGAVAPIPCHYYYTVTKKDQGAGEAMGKVAVAVVEQDRYRRGYKEYDLEAYHFFETLFKVEPADFDKLEVGKDYMFVSEPNQPLVKLCSTEECDKASRKFEETTQELKKSQMQNR